MKSLQAIFNGERMCAVGLEMFGHSSMVVIKKSESNDFCAWHNILLRSSIIAIKTTQETY